MRKTEELNIETRRATVIVALASLCQILGILAVSLYLFFKLEGQHLNSGWSTVVIATVFLLLNTFVVHLARKEKLTSAAFILVSQLMLVGIGLISFWGHDLPVGLLVIILSVALAGIAFGATSFFIASSIAVLSYVVIGILQLSRVYQVASQWKDNDYSYGDVVIYAATMTVIFVVTWLFNRQLHLAYIQAKSSESALRNQSEHLEEIVVERTKSLRQEHFQRVTDLHRFVLYGKEASGLLHDIINPLTALGLQIELIKKTQENYENLSQAEETLKRLENLVTGARRHMRREAAYEKVSVKEEVTSVFQSFEYRTRKHGIVLHCEGADQEFYTDPILIYKIIQNLVANAIDACLLVPPARRTIAVKLEKTAKDYRLLVQDTGVGIKPEHVEHIFEPYFTTKQRDEGSGIGLSLVKELIETELKGKIGVLSSESETLLTVTIPHHAVRIPQEGRTSIAKAHSKT